jgi:hypothetical protein
MGNRYRGSWVGLPRIAEDVEEELPCGRGGTEQIQSRPSEPEETEEARHRRTLAEPAERGQKRRLSPREEREQLRAEADLPP